MKKTTCNGRGGPSPALSTVAGRPPVRRADTQFGPYTHPPDEKLPRRRKWVVGLLAVAIAFPLCGAAAQAQQSGKIFRIGFLDSSTASGSVVLVEAFRQELSKLGWIEGKNITIEYRFAEQKNERLPELAAE